MKNKYLTTYWMDLITYIIIPFITIVAGIRIVRSLLYSTLGVTFAISLFIEIAFILLYVVTFLYSHKRTKGGERCFMLLVIATGIRAAVDFAITSVTNYNPYLAFFGYLLVCVALWVYPNYIYFNNRKELFKNDSFLNFAKKEN